MKLIVLNCKKGEVFTIVEVKLIKRSTLEIEEIFDRAVFNKHGARQPR